MEEIKIIMKEFAQQNGINIESIKKHFKKNQDGQRKHFGKRPHDESSERSEESQDDEIEITAEQKNLLKNKFLELKESNISKEEIKAAMIAFAEANGIDAEVLKKICKKQREEFQRRHHESQSEGSSNSGESHSESSEDQKPRERRDRRERNGERRQRGDRNERRGRREFSSEDDKEEK